MTVSVAPHPLWFDVMASPYNAKGDGTTNDTAAIQAAIDAAAVAGGIVVFQPKTYKVTTLQLKARVTLQGSCSAHGLSLGTILLGTAGSDVITLPTAAPYGAIAIRDLNISGGRNGLVSTTLTTYVSLDNVEIVGPSGACIYIEGCIEEWELRNVQLAGGQYGWKQVDTRYNSLSYIDKTDFYNCRIGGASKNNVFIECLVADSVAFYDLTLTTSGEHAFYMNCGARAIVFVNVNTEGNGTTGKKNRTTGTINSASNSLTVASATGYAIGDLVTVAGAGSNGADLSSVATNVSGTTVTLTDNAGTSVSGAATTNAKWDEFTFSSSIAQPAHVIFIGGQIGQEGSTGRLRYAMDASAATNISFTNSLVSSNIPIYDPTLNVTDLTGDMSIRQPASFSTTYLPKTFSFSRGLNSNEAQRSMLPSPGGKDIVMMLVDSVGNTTGTFGKFAVYSMNPSLNRRFYVDGSTGDVVQERTTARVISKGYLQIDPKANPANCTKGDLNVGTDGKLYVCSATDTWTLVGSQS